MKFDAIPEDEQAELVAKHFTDEDPIDAVKRDLIESIKASLRKLVAINREDFNHSAPWDGEADDKISGADLREWRDSWFEIDEDGDTAWSIVEINALQDLMHAFSLRHLEIKLAGVTTFEPGEF